MKKLLLAGVAALSVLTASAAHAAPFYKWQCGKYTVTLHASQPDSPKPYNSLLVEPFFPGRFNVNFKWDGSPGGKWVEEDEEADCPTATGGKAWLNGKRCKDYVPDKTKKANE